jgi:hypothetical protein
VRGQIVITYYGKLGPVEDQGAQPIYPDLTVTGLKLDAKNNLVIEIANKGPGTLASMYYEKNIPDLMIYRDGRGWGGMALNIFDPQKALRAVGSKITFTVDALTVHGTENIRVVVDAKNTLKENDEKNNEFTARLTAKKTQAALPDISVVDLYLSRENQIAVSLVNSGSAVIPASYWQNNAPTIYLYRNGKGWGGVTLKIFDPGMKLANPGGKVVYIFQNPTLTAKETIKVVFDSQNTLAESNENNNEMTKELTPRR